MNDIAKGAQLLLDEVSSLWQSLNLDTKRNELSEIDAQLADPNVWQDNLKAQELAKQQSKLQAATEPWQALKTKLEEVSELAQLNDASLKTELTKQLDEAEKTLAV